MQISEYIHEYDAYKVISHLFYSILGEFYRSNVVTYSLKDHRTMDEPRFEVQRAVLNDLIDKKYLKLMRATSKTGKPCSVEKAFDYEFKVVSFMKFKSLQNRLMLDLQNAINNGIAHNEKEKLKLSFTGGVIYVHTPHLRLRIKDSDIQPNGLPESFFIYLFEKADQKLVNRETFPHKTSQSFSDLMTKQGFNGLLRKHFVPVLTKDEVQLLTEVEVAVGEIPKLTERLLLIKSNKDSYIDYMKSINF